MGSITRAAIVTGAGSGIGLAVTKALVQTGINVVLNGRTEETLARAAAEIDEPSCWPLLPATSPGRRQPNNSSRRLPDDSGESTSS